MKFFYENKNASLSVRYGNRLDFGAHLHNHIELVYMIEGRAKAVVDSREYIISPEDAFIVFPNKIHQYQEIDYENYFISIFPPELCPEFHNIFKYKEPVSPLIGSAGKNAEILPLARKIVEIEQGNLPYHDILIKGYFLILLSELFQMVQFVNTKSNDGNTIKSILNYCTENYRKDMRLETISSELHISKYYISHLFTKKLHVSFNEYIGMLRISEACRLLSAQDSCITDIAYNVGFNSARTLNRLFLKYVGMTPREYIKSSNRLFIGHD